MANLKSIHDVVWDADEKTFITQDSCHLKLHNGEYFNTHHFFTDLGVGDMAELYVLAPNSTVRVHAAAYFTSTGKAQFSVRRSATITASGTLLANQNMNHNSLLTSTVIAKSSATITASGTEMSIVSAGGEGFKSTIGGASGGGPGRILKQGTVYIFRGEAKAASSDISIELQWHD